MKKVICNKDSDNTDGTSQYIGLDVGLGKTCKKFTTRFIFEKRFYSGTGAMIFTPNGNTSGAQILNRSIHVVFKNTYISIALINNSNNDFYSEHTLQTPLLLNGLYENEITIEIIDNTHIKMTVNNEVFTDEITGGLSLADYGGRYAVFEFFCLGDRNIISMPQYTYMKLTDNTGSYFDDNFNRANGLLKLTPDGHPYSLFT